MNLTELKQKPVPELLEIAREDGHLIAHDATEEIVLPPRENDHRTLVVTVPLVISVAALVWIVWGAAAGLVVLVVLVVMGGKLLYDGLAG